VRSTARPGALYLVASLALLALSAPATAAPRRITGELNRPGYTVIALTADGRASVAPARTGRFRLRPPAERVTLHLRAPDGTYAGPVVFGRNRTGRRAFVGVRAGARLGRVEIAVRRGYARLARRLPARSVDKDRPARARRGIPIGAGVVGRVRSRPPRDPIPGDVDLDGVEDPLDIDDDGDLVLDDFDRSTAVRAAQAPMPPSPPRARLTTSLHLEFGQSANANALTLAGLDRDEIAQQIDTALSAGGRLAVETAAGAELDCGGAANPSPPPPWLGGREYCRRGGTGIAPSAVPPEFPECCDSQPGDPPGGDGFGTVPMSVGFDAPFTLLPRTPQINTRDEIVVRFIDAEPFPVVLPYVFATVPVLVSYHDTAGNSGTVTYPPAAGSPSDLPVAAGTDSQVRVTMTLWRPQRRPIGTGEHREACLDATPPCDWIDIGGLTYSIGAEGAGGPCQQSAYSEDDPTTPQVEDDPNLTVPTDAVTDEGRGFRDSERVAGEPFDRPADPANRLTFTVNLTQCQPSTPAWHSGESRRVRLVATPPQDPVTATRGKAQQILQFRHR
jgi:hypothetical protein